MTEQEEIDVVQERQIARFMISRLKQVSAEQDTELRVLRALMNTYNVGGWTDAIEPMKRALRAEADADNLRSLLRDVWQHTDEDAWQDHFVNRIRSALK